MNTSLSFLEMFDRVFRAQTTKTVYVYVCCVYNTTLCMQNMNECFAYVNIN